MIKYFLENTENFDVDTLEQHCQLAQYWFWLQVFKIWMFHIRAPPLYYNPAFYPLMSIFAVERINWPPNPYSPSAHNGSVSSGLDNGASDDSEEDNNGHRQLVTIQLNLSLLVIWFKFRSLQVICCYITHCMKNLGIRVHIFAGTNGFIVILWLLD